MDSLDQWATVAGLVATATSLAALANVLAAAAAAVVTLVRRERRDGPVFPTPFLKRRDRRNTANEWRAARERLELGEYTFHSFRKTVATALDQAGLSARAIAEYLGHADPSLTMNVYMSKPVGGTAAARALDEVLRKMANK
ncbi:MULTISPECIES: tyrosine-type recombinase/integrase [Microbacterium]|uniref:tyrosine-type recombinase/integrase n=1 Tax=Microbacterium TaxID=33882 RepID=UPI0018E33D39|nr:MULTISPECIES: tyrosine-type recombinase/integrase [Microbacterium]